MIYLVPLQNNSSHVDDAVFIDSWPMLGSVVQFSIYS